MIGKAHLSGNDNDNNAIDIGISPEEYDGQTVFQNVANECVFHSPDSFAPLCIRCKFLNGETVVATGKIDPTPNSAYIGSTQITIPMSDPNPFLEDDEFAANGIDDVENVRLELCGVKDKCPDIHKDKCKCDERKKDHERHYYDSKEYYDKNKNKFGKGEYSEYMNDLEDYIDEKGKYMDRSTYKMFMDYHEKFLKDNKKSFSSNDYKHSSDEQRKYSNDYPNHHEKCECDDQNEDHERHYYDSKEYYDKNKNKFGKGGYSEYMNDLEDYIDEEGQYMDSS